MRVCAGAREDAKRSERGPPRKPRYIRSKRGARRAHRPGHPTCARARVANLSWHAACPPTAAAVLPKAARRVAGPSLPLRVLVRRAFRRLRQLLVLGFRHLRLQCNQEVFDPVISIPAIEYVSARSLKLVRRLQTSLVVLAGRVRTTAECRASAWTARGVHYTRVLALRQAFPPATRQRQNTHEKGEVQLRLEFQARHFERIFVGAVHRE